MSGHDESRGATIILEGELADVMETWPLQLAVTTADGARRHLVLADDVTVVGGGAPLGPGDLTPGMAIRVTATSLPGGGLTAQRVEVLPTGR